MQMQAYAVYDRKAESYAQPFFAPNHAVAIRNFEGAVRSGNSQLSTHPEDFSLWHLGEYDDEQGRFQNLQNPSQLLTAMAAKGN